MHFTYGQNIAELDRRQDMGDPINSEEQRLHTSTIQSIEQMVSSFDPYETISEYDAVRYQEWLERNQEHHPTDAEHAPLAASLPPETLSSSEAPADDRSTTTDEAGGAAESAALLSGLLKTTSYLLTITDFDELMRQCLLRTLGVLPMVQAGILWLYELRSGKLRVAAMQGLPLEPATLQSLQMCQIVPGEGLTGQVFQSGELFIGETHEGYSQFVERTNTNPAYKTLIKQMDEQLPRSLALTLLPLRTASEKIGLITLFHLPQQPADDLSAAPVCLSEERAQLLRQVLPTYSSLLASIIKNKQLYDQSQRHCRRLDAFDAVVTAISTATDLDDLLQSVLDVMMELLPVSSGAIFLLDPSQDRLTLGAYRGLPLEYIEAMHSFPVPGAACEEVVRYGQPTRRPLIDEEHGETMLLSHGLESCAYLPLLAGGTVVGALGLYGDGMLYKEIDMGSLMPLGNQVGFAIANVRLYEDSYLERRKLNTVVNSIAEGVVLCDSKGRLVLANEAAMSLLSLESVPYDQPLSEMPDFYSIRDLEGRPLPVEQLPMARALSGETFHDYRVLLHGVSGDNSVMSFSGAPAVADNRTIEGAVVVFRDITANQKLERAKDEFLAVAAHELRSPLAAVRSYAEMLLRRERQRNEEDSRDVRGLTILSEQVTHMLRMVDNLLDVSRLDAGQLDLQLQRVNLVSLATQVLDQQRPAAREQELILQNDQPELWVECDSMRVRQVLTNLVSNAIKYGPPGTSIIVQLTTRSHPSMVEGVVPMGGQTTPLLHEIGPESNFETELSVRLPQREALVSVSDHGSGITLEQQMRLFERFYRVHHRRAEGLGLGLYLSREFVLMHGGHIWVESAEGKGSTFSFTLPMRED